MVEIVPRPTSPAIIDTARSYLNIIDTNGKRNSKEIMKFIKSGGGRSGDNWCQHFVYHCHFVNGITEFRTGNANEYADRLKNKYGSFIGEVQDKYGLIVWINPKTMNQRWKTGHIGFIEKKINKSFVRTIEGNTSWDNTSPDGRNYKGKTGVFPKVRSIKKGSKLGKNELRLIVQ